MAKPPIEKKKLCLGESAHFAGSSGPHLDAGQDILIASAPASSRRTLELAKGARYGAGH
jgi:hypothetical protein